MEFNLVSKGGSEFREDSKVCKLRRMSPLAITSDRPRQEQNRKELGRTGFALVSNPLNRTFASFSICGSWAELLQIGRGFGLEADEK